MLRTFHTTQPAPNTRAELRRRIAHIEAQAVRLNRGLRGFPFAQDFSSFIGRHPVPQLQKGGGQ